MNVRKVNTIFMDAGDRILENLCHPSDDGLPGWKKQELLEIATELEGLRADLVSAGYPKEWGYPHTTAYINANKPFSKEFIDMVLSWGPNKV